MQCDVGKDIFVALFSEGYIRAKAFEFLRFFTNSVVGADHSNLLLIAAHYANIGISDIGNGDN